METNPSRRRVTLRICGTDYVLSTDETEEYMQMLGKQVDKSMQELLTDQRMTLNMAAILTALTYADMAEKANQTADHLRSQLKDYLEENSLLRQELNELRQRLHNATSGKSASV